MRYLSVCSGIEAATAAWHSLGWEPVAFSEVDAFPSAVLKHHYPDVPNWGDMTKFQEWPDADVDVLVGGTPCQSFSIAGLRGGLADPRGSLMLTYLGLIGRYRPRWVVWENVPGVLSADGGRAFGSLLGGLAELGYGFAYRVLDAQYFGVAQRRRRVFVVGCLGDWRRAAAVLSERESLSGHPAPRREAGQKPAPTLGAGPVGGGRKYGLYADSCESLIPQTVGALCDGAHRGGGLTGRTPTAGASLPSLANPLTARMGKGINTTCDEGQTLIPGQIGGVFDGSEMAFTTEQTPKWNDDQALTLTQGSPTGGGHPQAVAYAFDARQSDVTQYGDKSGPLDTDGHSIGLMQHMAVRRLTPLVAFSAKDYGADAGDIAPTLRAGGHAKSHANGGVMPAIAIPINTQIATRHNALGERTGLGIGEDGEPAFTLQAAHSHAVMHETLSNEGINHASTPKTHAGSLLRTLREEVGAEAFTQWGLGILDSLLPAEVLRSRLHGCGVRLAAFSRRWLVYHALSRPEAHSEGIVLAMREAECEGCASQGWRPPEQLARELGAYLSELSHPGAQASRFMLDLWQAGEGLGLLRQALSAVQEVGRPAPDQGEPAPSTFAVRRLTVEECEFLQGFPRGYTAIPYRGKPAADGNRYKALGNSMAVPVMHWIGKRIQMVEAI